jgi:pyruvate formate lyase activating enzyme
MCVEGLVAEVVRDRVFYEVSGGGVTFSGGEPLDQPRFLVAALRACRQAGIETAVDTSCHAPSEVLAHVAHHTELFLVDIKHMDSAKHYDATGVGNDLVLANIRWLADQGAALVVRVPLIAGVNDDEANAAATAMFVTSLKCVRQVDLLPFTEGGIAKGQRLVPSLAVSRHRRPSATQVERVASHFEDVGLVVRVGA